MTAADFFKEVEFIYGWDLLPKERDVIEAIARKQGGEKTLKAWKDFQDKFPGHSVAQFKKAFCPEKEIEFW